MKTYAPDLDPAVPGRLRRVAAPFAADFPRARPALWASVYLQGLLLDGERKSIELLSRRVTLPDGLAVKGPDQALQQFVSQNPRDERAVLRRSGSLLAQTFASLDGVFLFETFPSPSRAAVPSAPGARTAARWAR